CPTSADAAFRRDAHRALLLGAQRGPLHDLRQRSTTPHANLLLVQRAHFDAGGSDAAGGSGEIGRWAGNRRHGERALTPNYGALTPFLQTRLLTAGRQKALMSTHASFPQVPSDERPRSKRDRAAGPRNDGWPPFCSEFRRAVHPRETACGGSSHLSARGGSFAQAARRRRPAPTLTRRRAVA